MCAFPPVFRGLTVSLERGYHHSPRISPSLPLFMINFLRQLFSKQLGSGRSSDWPKVRKEYILAHPTCAVCSGLKKCEVHHIKPFNLEPQLELDPSNFITLCRKNNCHLMLGHLMDYSSWNSDIIKDADYINNKIINRPYDRPTKK